jgi:acyl-CoA thioesterase
VSDEPPVLEHFQDDPLADHLNMTLVEARDGYARTEMEAAEELRGFQGYLPSGVLLALADYALTAASNPTGAQAVPLNLACTFVGRVRPGGRLVAQAQVEKAGRRTALYRLEVRTEGGELLAAGQGLVYRQESTASS